MHISSYDKNESYIFCFGLNDLMSSIPEHVVINNYKLLIKNFPNCQIILPPFQTTYFYDKCIEELDTTIVLSFTQDYRTIDKIHPTTLTLQNLKIDIEI